MALLEAGDVCYTITLVMCMNRRPKVEERQNSHPVWIFLHNNLIHLESEVASALFLASSFGQHYTFYISIIWTTV